MAIIDTSISGSTVENRDSDIFIGIYGRKTKTARIFSPICPPYI